MYHEFTKVEGLIFILYTGSGHRLQLVCIIYKGREQSKGTHTKTTIQWKHGGSVVWASSSSWSLILVSWLSLSASFLILLFSSFLVIVTISSIISLCRRYFCSQVLLSFFLRPRLSRLLFSPVLILSLSCTASSLIFLNSFLVMTTNQARPTMSLHFSSLL